MNAKLVPAVSVSANELAYAPPTVLLGVATVLRTVKLSVKPRLPSALSIPEANVSRPDCTSITASSVLAAEKTIVAPTEAILAEVSVSSVNPVLILTTVPPNVMSPVAAKELAKNAMLGMAHDAFVRSPAPRLAAS